MEANYNTNKYILQTHAAMASFLFFRAGQVPDPLNKANPICYMNALPKTLLTGTKNYPLYITGFSVANLLCYFIFITHGHYFIGLLHSHKDVLNCIMGSVLLLTGLLHAVKIIRSYQTTAFSHDS